MIFNLNIKMNIILFCFIKLIIIHLTSSQPGFVCEYVGVASLATDYQFTVTNLPTRCDYVSYGNYYITLNSTSYPPIYSDDEDAIKSLTSSDMPTYVYISCNTSVTTWDDVLNDETTYDTVICQLAQTIDELQLFGVILNIGDLYDGTPDFDTKISTFTSKLKEKSPKVKVGLNVEVLLNQAYTKIPNKDLFDYTITNSVIDQYFVNMNTHDDKCTPELSCSGTVISSSDGSAITVELFSNAINNSTMDKTKTVACINIFPLSPNSSDVFTPYSAYCSTPDAAGSTSWCIEHTKRLYDIGAFVKNCFSMVTVDWVEYDDDQNVCGCQPYPAINALFDGCDGTPYTPCPSIG